MVNCCVPQCTNYSAKTQGRVSYHRFPEDDRLKKTWIQRIRRENLPPIKNCYVCSDHFLPDQFETNLSLEVLGVKSRARLKRDAVPSIFEFGPERKKARTSTVRRVEQRDRKEVSSLTVSPLFSRSLSCSLTTVIVFAYRHLITF